jgi:hypothetical protein
LCQGINCWREKKRSHDFDNINLQLAYSRIAAGIKHFCSPFVVTCEQGEKLLFYIALCLRNLFEIIEFENFTSDIASLVKGFDPQEKL